MGERRSQLPGKHCGAFRRKNCDASQCDGVLHQGMRFAQPDLCGFSFRIGIVIRRVSMTVATFEKSVCCRPGIHGVQAGGVLALMQAMPVLGTIRAAPKHRTSVLR